MKTSPTSDRPVETASNHSELAYNVETDSSLTEDYEAPDQVVPTDSIDRSKNEEEQSYTVSIKSYVLKKKNKKLRKVRCKICNASCEGVKSLNEHHCSEHDIQFCSDCGKGFATQTALDKHTYVHGELNFVCETCGKAFPFDSRLQQHKLTHFDVHHYCMRNGCKNTSSPLEILTDMCSHITNLYIIIVTTALIKTLIREIQSHICAYMLWEMSVMFATLVKSHLGLIPSIGATCVMVVIYMT